MALVVANEGKPELLDLLLRELTIPNVYFNLFLFSNDYTPVANMSILSFEFPDWDGYADQTLLRAGWNPAGFTTGKGLSTYGTAPNSWVVGADGGTVFGYGVQSLVTENMLWAERFAHPRILFEGDIQYLQIQVTDDTDPFPL